MEIVHRICAGLDVHKESVVACIRSAGETERSIVRTFGTVTRDLEALAKWLAKAEVTHVAMEATGVYWKPVWNVLELEDRFQLLLCNPHHAKQVKGRKTDVKDCEWIAKLMQHGLLEASFVPARDQRELRDLTRYRAKLAGAKTAEINRLQKLLEDANIKFGDVASDVMGASGRDMIRAMISGETDPDRLANLAKHVLRKKIPALRFALRGRIGDHHRFMLRMHLEAVESIEARTRELDERISALTHPDPTPEPEGPNEAPAEQSTLFPSVPDAGPPAPATTRAPSPVSPIAPSLPVNPDATPLTYSEAIRLLDTIPGINVNTAEGILAEIGTDMSRFPSAAHLSSWAGMCPGNNQSAGKKKSSKTTKGNVALRRLLGIAAACQAPQKNFLATKYRRIKKRRGSNRAIVAVGNAILRIAYFVLSNRQEYRELGADYYDRLNSNRQIRYHRKRLAQLELANKVDAPEAA